MLGVVSLHLPGEILRAALVDFSVVLSQFVSILVDFALVFSQFESILLSFNQFQSMLVSFNKTKTQNCFTEREGGAKQHPRSVPSTAK